MVRSEMGTNAEVDLTHRCWLDPAPAFRPFQDAVFDGIGGQPTVDRLVDALYDLFEADGLLRPLFGKDLSHERTNQKRFFAEWLGGPPRYSESTWAALHQRHEDLPITSALAERWLGHLRGALQEAVSDDRQRGVILERAQAVALSLVNHDPEEITRSVQRARAVSRHRSERIASCGVGARTVKQALLLAQRGELHELTTLVADVPDLLGRGQFAARLLQGATLAGRTAVVEWLTDCRVDLNKPWPLPTGTVGGAFEGVLFATPLCAARMKRRSDISTYLLRRGARDDIFTAAFLGDVPFVHRVLETRPSLAQVSDPATDALTITPIHHAVAGNQLPTLRALLDRKAGPLRTGARALRAAAERGRREMVELLLEHGADAHAIGAGRWVLDAEMAPKLARSGASAGVGLDGEESSDWVKFSCTGNQGRKDDPAYVAALLDHGARVDQRYNGASPLHYAVKAGFVGTIQLLLERGADTAALDERGRTPGDWLARAAKSVDRDAVGRALKTRTRWPG